MPSEQRRVPMGSDRERVDRALEALAPAAEAFRSAVARTMDEIRARLSARASETGVETVEAELGPLARGRIDTERFASVYAGEEALDERSAATLRRAMEVLAAVDAAGSEAFLLELEPGRPIAEASAEALARSGRAFGAARVAEAARSGGTAPGGTGDPLSAFPPTLWNRGERSVAPPLVVALRGEDLRAGSLAELLDGGQKLVLVVEGEAPPAPLVGLVSPSVLVLQTRNPEELAMVADHEGPAVAALFPEGARAASFLHDPAAGDALVGRLAVRERPDETTLRPVGSISVFRQREELSQLGAMATAGVGTAGPSTNGAAAAGSSETDEQGVEPADRLAAWLLRQANLSGLS